MEHMEQNMKKVEISRKITFRISENTSKKRNKNRNICYRFFFLAAAYLDRGVKSALPTAACVWYTPAQHCAAYTNMEASTGTETGTGWTPIRHPAS